MLIKRPVASGAFGLVRRQTGYGKYRYAVTSADAHLARPMVLSAYATAYQCSVWVLSGSYPRRLNARLDAVCSFPSRLVCFRFAFFALQTH